MGQSGRNNHSINSIVFATHNNGKREAELVMKTWRDIAIWDLPEKLCEIISNDKEVRWILNLDIDYFFTGRGNEFQFLTDLYIQRLCDQINSCRHRIDVITIALSPDFTGGWSHAKRISELIADRLNLSFQFPMQIPQKFVN